MMMMMMMSLDWCVTAFVQLLGLSEKVVGNGIHKLESIIGFSGFEKEEQNVKTFEGTNMKIELCKEEHPNGFEMPLHYPHFNKEDYQNMEEWKLDMLLREYGLRLKGNLDEKKAFAVGIFLWPDQL